MQFHNKTTIAVGGVAKWAILKHLLACLIVCLTMYAVKAQVPTQYSQTPLIPESGVYASNAKIAEVDVSVNIDKSILEAEDLQNSKNNQPYRFAVSVPTNIGVAEGGKYSTPEGEVWKVKIASKGATSMSLIFDQFELPKSASMYVYNEERTMVMGPITYRCNASNGTYITDVIKGEALIVEYFDPMGTVDNAQLHIAEVARGYREFVGFNNHKEYGDSDDCENDIVCAEGNPWCIEERAVSLILLANNTRICTGTMLNNTAEDLRPLFLTADHCLGGSNTWQFRFHYKNPTCGATTYAGTTWTYSNSTLLANDADTDFALLEVTGYDPFDNWHRLGGVHFAGWSRNTNPTSGVGIHHPNGDVMKISFDWAAPTSAGWAGLPANSHWDVDYDDGTVEHGSSGSALFNQNHRVIGQLHGTQDPNFSGSNYCESFDSRYGRLDQSWNGGGTNATRLRNWLDPLGTNAMTTDPISPLVIFHNLSFSGTNTYTATDQMELAGEVNGYPVPPPVPLFWGWPVNGLPFVVNGGANVTFQAGEEIVIRPGVEVHAGADFRAHIAPVGCGTRLDYGRIGEQGDIDEANHAFNTRTGNSNAVAQFAIMPNPNNGTFNVSWESETPATIEVYDAIGHIVWSKEKVQQNTMNIDITSQPKGIYLVRIATENQTFTERVIRQ